MARNRRDRYFMERAIQEMCSSKSEHESKEDPMVGAVLVSKSGQELACAYRGMYPGHHAEFTVFEKIMQGETPDACTLYVTLEPCWKRQAPKKPCTHWIVKNGVKRVVVGILDPDRDVNGRGRDLLEDHGVRVEFFDYDLQDEIRGHLEKFRKDREERQRTGRHTMGEASKMEGPTRAERDAERRASVEDFSRPAIQSYLVSIGLPCKVPSETLWQEFRKREFLVRRGRQWVPTKLGIVLFAKNPTTFFPEYFIRAEHFRGTPEDGTSLERIAPNGRKHIEGPLLETVQAGWDFYQERAGKVSRIEGFVRRDDQPEFPDKVVREALVNALVHRRYDDDARGMHITLEVFRDRVVISSPGKPVGSNTVEALNRGEVSKLRRNEGLGKAAAEMNLMERRGGGIQMMRNTLNGCGLLPPSYEYRDPYLVLTLWGVEKSLPTSLMPGNLRAQLRPRQLTLLNLIRERMRITSKEYRAALARRKTEPPITHETANQDFRHLIKLGLLERKGTGKATYYTLSPFFVARSSIG